jgi:RNA polymerase sigma factor (TIGR02999 family)
MSRPPDERVTRLLDAAADGDSGAASDLLPVVYDELRRLARAQLRRESPGQTLQPTALVHEAFLRLVGPADLEWKGRGHFFGAAARAMRRILVERARRRRRIKHGGRLHRTDLEPDRIEAPEQGIDVLALHEALDRLEARDRRKSEVVHLRYFAGLSVEETAAALNLSPTTVKSEWNFARAWLRRAVRDSGVGEEGGRE